MDQLLATDGFTPLGLCFKWNSLLVLMLIVGNLLAAVSFFTIPVAVLSYLRRTQYPSTHWIFYLFTSACITCGISHALKIWTVYNPVFGLSAMVDVLSGGAFLATSIMIWPLIPKLLALPQPAQMEKAYDELKAEMIRRESAEYRNRQLASIVESSNDAIISFLLNGTVLSWNRGAQELFGYSVESTMGRTMRQLIGPDMDTVIQVLREGRKLDMIEVPYNRREGKTVYLSLCVSPIKDANGEVTSGAAIFRDITLIKQAEQELVKASEQLSQSNKELEDFAWVAAHDLKEPVRTMATYSKLLGQEYADQLDDQAKQFLSFIHGSSVMAMARIDDVLKFSNVRREKFEANAVDLNDVAIAVMQDLQLAIKESGVKITIPEQLPVVKGRSEYLSLLMQNILSNAMKYRSKASPAVEITAARDGSNWVISVRDNGIGFAMEHADKIFQMFQRLHADEYPGTGLGLAMCKKIVELHGGKIWAQSTVGEGTVFHFSIPANDQA